MQLQYIANANKCDISSRHMVALWDFPSPVHTAAEHRRMTHQPKLPLGGDTH